ncbi:type II toxin-antitoxin system HicA family toxin [Rugamonas sp. CCM 8940]|uniref:type II toxin-antitoxin system HicA family toxin n=1 Tax=Rugamonas sp. CCM 8940 TaxID=2765359 RepID=UPI0018F4A25B|nr:type II toxin-antitoxin system HicA family toxin [Rugamonas sp. CCM 8940]MBJ7314190.1 type II toxin-antitoxin system HicA family toxin [Rugamonas sp. CCM 8940]
MKLPRGLSAAELIAAPGKLGYAKVRQTASHVRLRTSVAGEHHLTVPLHDPVRVGTLSAILNDVAQHHALGGVAAKTV